MFVKHSRILVSGVLAVSFAACDRDFTPPVQVVSIDEVISHVSTTGGVVGSVRFQRVPSGGAGPVISTSAASAAIPGGSIPLSVESATSFQQVVVFIPGDIQGHWRVDLPAPTNEVQLVVTLSQDLDLTNTFSVGAMAGSGGSWGNMAFSSMTPIAVGTGEVQVSAAWDTPSDVDIHVVEPGGEEVYFGNTASATGGQLDLDSNAACSIDDTNQENITWETAPAGEYIVRIEYWSACEAVETNWIVTVIVEGQTPQVFTGVFTGTGTGGGAGAGTEVARFTF